VFQIRRTLDLYLLLSKIPSCNPTWKNTTWSRGPQPPQDGKQQQKHKSKNNVTTQTHSLDTTPMKRFDDIQLFNTLFLSLFTCFSHQWKIDLPIHSPPRLTHLHLWTDYFIRNHRSSCNQWIVSDGGSVWNTVTMHFPLFVFSKIQLKKQAQFCYEKSEQLLLWLSKSRLKRRCV